MNEFRRIEAIDIDFFPKDLYLINKNAEKFNTLTLIYSEYSFDELVSNFFKFGNKRFKTKKARLEFLAVYQAILNHDALMPTQDKLQAGVEEQLFRLGYPVITEGYEDDEEIENGEESVESIDESQSESSTQQEEYTKMNNYDIQHKWGRILARIEEIKDYAEDVIQNVVEKYEQNTNQRNAVQVSGGEEVYIMPEGKQNEDCMFR